MRFRSPHLVRNSLRGTGLAALAALALTGCQSGEPDQAAAPTATVSPSAAGTSPSASTAPPAPSPSDSATATTGPLPDVCTLLSRAEVKALTGGKSLLSVDHDGAGPGATVRHCQWQLSGARVAVQLSHTTEARFRQDHPGAQPVTGLGDEAHFFSNHLFIRKGAIQVDVYAGTTEGTAADRRLAKAAAAVVVPRL